MFVDPETLQQTTVKLSSGVWTVIFKGMFYEPSGPAPSATDTPRARERVCAEVIVWVTDSTGGAGSLTFGRADSCS